MSNKCFRRKILKKNNFFFEIQKWLLWGDSDSSFLNILHNVDLCSIAVWLSYAYVIHDICNTYYVLHNILCMHCIVSHSPIITNHSVMGVNFSNRPLCVSAQKMVKIVCHVSISSFFNEYPSNSVLNWRKSSSWRWNFQYTFFVSFKHSFLKSLFDV